MSSPSSSTCTVSPVAVTIGVLALQGAFIEHIASLETVKNTFQLNVQTKQVRTVKELNEVDGLIIPGGESTAISLLAETAGLLEPLREWVRCNRPVFGTCAGLILLADEIEKQKQGGQEKIGGLHVRVVRNFYGRQLASFEETLAAPKLKAFGAEKQQDDSCKATFIRAPAISFINVHQSDQSATNQQEETPAASTPAVEVLASLPLPALKDRHSTAQDVVFQGERANASHTPISYPVAVQQGNIMAASFHPELTQDVRWHHYFVHLTQTHKQQQTDKAQQ